MTRLRVPLFGYGSRVSPVVQHVGINLGGRETIRGLVSRNISTSYHHNETGRIRFTQLSVEVPMGGQGVGKGYGEKI